MIRVLVIEDSPSVRRILERELGRFPDIDVVGTASDPYEARDKLALAPDVLTLDLELPRMDGISFLQRLMEHHPIPVVVLSALVPAGSALAMRALALGATDVIAKPSHGLDPDTLAELGAAIRSAACARVGRSARGGVCKALSPRALRPRARPELVGIAASTGGPPALEHVLSHLPADFPPVVVTQHLDAAFSTHLASYLASSTALRVHLATEGETLRRGTVVLAPGGRHLRVVRRGAELVIKLDDGPRVHHVRPSADVMFQSIAETCGAAAIGVILTGMGSDGAEGLRAMHDAGAITLAESEKSAVVYGMPQAAVRAGAVDYVCHLHGVATELVQLITRAEPARAT